MSLIYSVPKPLSFVLLLFLLTFMPLSRHFQEEVWEVAGELVGLTIGVTIIVSSSIDL